MKLAPFADIAVALRLEANELARAAEEAEITAVFIGLSDGAKDRVVREKRAQAALVGDAFKLMRGLMPMENTIRAVLDRGAD